jgi:hypothetical protein
MSIHDERDLRDKLGSALDEFDPSPLPLHAVVRQGRAVIVRRRVTAAAYAAAVAAAAALAPTLVHALHRPSPEATRHYHVTLHPPRPASPHGVVAFGLVNHARWQLTVRLHAHGSETCVSSVAGFASCTGGRPPVARMTAPAKLFGDPDQTALLPDGRGVRVQMLYGPVRRDVTHLRVELGNGQVLTLRPAAIFGSRYASWVALAVPFAAAVREVIAYSATGEVGYAIPFTAAGSIELVRWLAPAHSPTPRPTTVRLGVGSTGGTSWSARAYLGPWGACFTSAAVVMDICRASASALRAGQLVATMVSSHAGHLNLTAVEVAPAVNHLIVTTARGRTFVVTPVAVGKWRYCIVPAYDHDPDISWTAYGASGTRLGMGSARGW